MKIMAYSLAFAAVFLVHQKCLAMERQRPSPPPGFMPKPFQFDKLAVLNTSTDNPVGQLNGTGSNAKRRAILSPAEAYKKIFGNLDADKPEKVQKRIKELEKVRDLVAEYNELVAKKAAERGPAEPLSERLREKFEMMRAEMAAAKAARAKQGKVDEEEKMGGGMNQELEGYLIEGDIIPTVEDMEDRLAQLRGGEAVIENRNNANNDNTSSSSIVNVFQLERRKKEHLRPKRGAVNFANYPNNKWDISSTVYYMFAGNLSTSNIAAAEAAFSFYYDTTCLFYEKVTSPPPAPTPYILIQAGSPGTCNSYVGKINPPNIINLGTGCESSAPHEIGHALGLYHTQSRYDRGTFIDVHLENANGGTSNYNLQTSTKNDNYNVLYDYGSRMHYNAMSNSGNGLPVIVAREEHHQNTMGQRLGMAFSDHLMLNRAYCSANCPAGATGTAACRNGGYPNPNWCNQCLCPSGWGGLLCDQRQAATPNANCTGATITASTSWQLLESSVNNPTGKGVESCHWHIKAPSAGQWVDLWIEEVAPVGDNSCDYGCGWADVEFKVANFTRTGYRMCCQSDLAPQGYVVLTSTAGFAIVNANSKSGKKAFRVWHIAY